MIDRRHLLAAGMALVAAPSWAAEPALDWQGAEPDPAVAERIARQVAMVQALPVSADALAFFAAQPIAVIRQPGIGSFADERGVFLTRDPFPDDNPVLLHELLHRYHWQRLGDGPRNPEVIALMEQARATGHWPADSYMFKNPSEFLAMVGSVVLHGRAARPPYTRAEVHAFLPQGERWLVDLFALREKPADG